MSARRPVDNVAKSPQKKRSLFAANEDNYSLSLKVLPSAMEKINSKKQREIKNALREIDDILYTLIYSQDEATKEQYDAANKHAEIETKTETTLTPVTESNDAVPVGDKSRKK